MTYSNDRAPHEYDANEEDEQPSHWNRTLGNFEVCRADHHPFALVRSLDGSPLPDCLNCTFTNRNAAIGAVESYLGNKLAKALPAVPSASDYKIHQDPVSIRMWSISKRTRIAPNRYDRTLPKELSGQWKTYDEALAALSAYLQREVA